MSSFDPRHPCRQSQYRPRIDPLSHTSSHIFLSVLLLPVSAHAQSKQGFATTTMFRVNSDSVPILRDAILSCTDHYDLFSDKSTKAGKIRLSITLRTAFPTLPLQAKMFLFQRIPQSGDHFSDYFPAASSIDFLSVSSLSSSGSLPRILCMRSSRSVAASSWIS